MSSSRNVSFNSSILFGCSFVAIIPVLNRLLLLNRFCEPYRRKYENILIHIQRIIFAVHMQTPQCSRIVFYPPCNRHQLSLINIVYFFFFFLFGQCILFPFLSLLIFFTFFFFFSFRFLSCFFFCLFFSSFFLFSCLPGFREFSLFIRCICSALSFFNANGCQKTKNFRLSTACVQRLRPIRPTVESVFRDIFLRCLSDLCVFGPLCRHYVYSRVTLIDLLRMRHAINQIFFLGLFLFCTDSCQNNCSSRSLSNSFQSSSLVVCF